MKALDVSLVHKLKDSNLGVTFHNLLETDSTMKVAERLIESKLATHGTVICAEFQHGGIGRVTGRTWDSDGGQNILCTAILEQSRVPIPANRVVIATCVSIVQALRKLGFNAVAKWPNDVHVAGRKISGNMVNSVESFYILGFGVNVNQKFDGGELAHQPVTSVVDILGEATPREPILADILTHLEFYLNADFADLLHAFRKYDCLVGNDVIVFPKGRENEMKERGSVLKIDDQGFLVVLIDGQERTLSSEEVSIRLEHLPAKFQESKLPRQSINQVIAGAWQNTLGSFVVFETHENGALTGYYQTAVGNVPNNERYPLFGSFSALRDGGALLGWTVCWNQSNGAPRSSTSWSGRLILNESTSAEGYQWHPTIDSTWLLTSDKPAWASVLTNKDKFSKVAH